MQSTALLGRFREATQAAYEAQGDGAALWRLAELDRALGNLDAAGEEYGKYAELHPEGQKAPVLRDLMLGSGQGAIPSVDGVAPFVLVRNVAPESTLRAIRQSLEERRGKFSAGGVVRENADQTAQKLDLDIRVAFSFRADAEFRELTQGHLWRAIERHGVIERLSAGSLKRDAELGALAYAEKGKYAIHRDNLGHGFDVRILTVIWFVHDEPKGFTGGDLLLHDEPPQGQGFTRIIPQRNTAIFFPSGALHEVTPLESAVEDVLQSRVVLNGWFHRADA